MSANGENLDTVRSTADDETGSEPSGNEVPDQGGVSQVTGGKRIDGPSISDLGPDAGSRDDAPDRGEVF